MKRLRKNDPIWLVNGDGTVSPGRFTRYLGKGRCKFYLINNGFSTAPRGLLKERKSRVNGMTGEVLGPIAVPA